MQQILGKSGELRYSKHPYPTKKEDAMKTKCHQITQEERCSITALLRMGRSRTEIAGELGRDRSTIYRELNRNATRHDGDYRAAKAQQYSVARRRRVRRGPQFFAEQMDEVDVLLKKKWSPEQVSAVLKEQGVFSISHETIYWQF